jgi:hypothetical protein
MSIDDSDLDDHEFVSADDIDADNVLFGDVDPNDLHQGQLGDCWLISAMAGVAEYPSYIENMIDDNGNGTYTVNLYSYANGSMQAYKVDNTFPAENGRPAYVQITNQSEIWPCVLEKGFAKMAGGYLELKGGFSVWAFGAMTGCTDLEVILLDADDGPTIGSYAELPDSDDPQDWSASYYSGDSMDLDGLVDLLAGYDNKKYLMCAGSEHGGDDTHKSADNIVQGHAYTILQVAKNPAGTEYNLIKCRNPWGHCEWSGAWSDGDSKWDDEPDVAAELEYSDVEDGAFWMSFEDFQTQYKVVYVCKKGMSGFAGGATPVTASVHKAVRKACSIM